MQIFGGAFYQRMILFVKMDNKECNNSRDNSRLENGHFLRAEAELGGTVPGPVIRLGKKKKLSDFSLLGFVCGWAC